MHKWTIAEADVYAKLHVWDSTLIANSIIYGGSSWQYFSQEQLFE